MAEVHGKAGSITLASLTVGVKSWSLSYTADAPETTDFADAVATGNTRTFIPGLRTWTATVEANWDAANTLAPGDAAATLTLTANSAATADTYSGSAICTGLTVGVSYDGVNTATYTFQGTGALTVTLSA
jgi:hypothetical protein